MEVGDDVYVQKLGNLVSEQARFIGYVFLVLGAGIVYFAPIISVPVLIFSAFVLINGAGVKIDFQKSQYKEYRSWIGIETGSWKAIPAFTHISVFRTVMKSRLESRGGLGVDYSDYVYKVKLVDSKSKEGLLVFSSLEKKMVLKKADYFSAKLGIPVSDNSNPPAKSSALRRR
jgi:hypothetical protein